MNIYVILFRQAASSTAYQKSTQELCHTVIKFHLHYLTMTLLNN